MSRANVKSCSRPAVTLMELVIAMAMIGIIFAAILPQFALIRNSWDVKQGTSEALQNGRVLMDHISRNLSKAVRITAVTEFSDTEGHIEYEDNDGNIMKYDYVASGNYYVKFGPQPGTLSDLAGPVSSLKFTCYDACDLDDDDRLLRIQTTSGLSRLTPPLPIRVLLARTRPLPPGSICGQMQISATGALTMTACMTPDLPATAPTRSGM
jgi:type II secretory pathway pseudopilin PulG